MYVHIEALPFSINAKYTGMCVCVLFPSNRYFYVYNRRHLASTRSFHAHCLGVERETRSMRCIYIYFGHMIYIYRISDILMLTYQKTNRYEFDILYIWYTIHGGFRSASVPVQKKTDKKQKTRGWGWSAKQNTLDNIWFYRKFDISVYATDQLRTPKAEGQHATHASMQLCFDMSAHPRERSWAYGLNMIQLDN